MGLDRSSFLHILHVKFPQFELPAASRAHGKLHFFMRAVLFNLNTFKVCTESLPAERCGDITDAAGTDNAPFLQVN